MFFFIGPQKTGSAWLRSCIREHPNICVPQRVNETCFFDRYFERGIEWYEQYFVECDAGKIVGEVAPTYFAARDVADRIRRVCPEARIVTSLRDPVDRAWSMYRYLLQKGDTRSPFRPAVEEFPNILTDGLYTTHLAEYRERFADSQILNMIYEDLIADPEASLAEIFRFLQVDGTFLPQAVATRVNEGRTPRSFWIARWVHRVVRKLHQRQLHEVVHAAKSIGLKEFVFRPIKAGTQMTMAEADRLWCIDYFHKDVEALSHILRRDLTALWLGAKDARPKRTTGESPSLR